MTACILCAAHDFSSAGRVYDDTGPLPFCAEHHASLIERANRPKAPRTVTIPLSGEELLVERGQQTALATAAAEDSAPPPAGTVLH